MKKTALYLLPIVLGATALWLCLNSLHYVGVASAQGSGDPSSPTSSDIVNFLTNGEYLPAIGAGLVLLVGFLRNVALKKVAWLQTQMGGYVLAYGTTMMLFVGTALEQHEKITLRLLLMALSSAIASAGVLNHWRDAKESIKKVPPVAGAATLLLVAVGAFTVLGGAGSCGSNPPKPIADVIDCTKQDQAQIAAAEAECASKIPDWGAAEACVVGKLPTIGWQIGGCVIADLAQQYLTKKGTALDVAQSNSAKKALEDYRANYGHNASFHTADGDL